VRDFFWKVGSCFNSILFARTADGLQLRRTGQPPMVPFATVPSDAKAVILPELRGRLRTKRAPSVPIQGHVLV